MRNCPVPITILSLYLLIVFSISLIGSAYGLATAAPPYSPTTWALLAIPKMLALAAGFALWKMLRIGAYLWATGIAGGWLFAIALGSGFFPSLTVATLVSVAIVVLSAWALIRHWSELRDWGSPLGDKRESDA